MSGNGASSVERTRVVVEGGSSKRREQMMMCVPMKLSVEGSSLILNDFQEFQRRHSLEQDWVEGWGVRSNQMEKRERRR